MVKKHVVYSFPCMICKYIMIGISNTNLTAAEAVLQHVVAKMWATLETGMEILKIMSDFIKNQSFTHQTEDLLRTLNIVKIILFQSPNTSVKPSWKNWILTLNTKQ